MTRVVNAFSLKFNNRFYAIFEEDGNFRVLSYYRKAWHKARVIPPLGCAIHMDSWAIALDSSLSVVV